MFRKFFCVLLVLMLVNVHGCFPAYADNEGVFTLEPGKIYTIRFNYNYESFDLVFSDYVLCSWDNYGYSDVSYYNILVSRYTGTVLITRYRLHVYNWLDKDITMTVNDGIINSFTENQSPFTLVMFDGSEEAFKMTNISDGWIDFKRHYYNEDDGSISLDTSWKTFNKGERRTFGGKGILIFGFPTGDVPYKLQFDGVYEVGDRIREGFFRVPPWILEMDLAGMIQALLDQLSTLLPVGLVILSVFLLISLTRYIVRLFL